jgi:site-specific DNA-methyltransferase (adenine-specific)
MGKSWDGDVPSIEIWAECLRVLKPGGHLLAFAGTRTQHRMACRIEDGGFEIRDMLAWLYGSGFPKHGNALKPALEPITLARKPLCGSVAANVAVHGTGGLSIDGCRVGTESTLRTKAGGSNQYPHEDDAWQPKTVQVGSDAGRWPANLLHDGSPEVVALFPVTGKSTGGGRNNGDKFGGGYAPSGDTSIGYGDAGSAARFFYAAKASKRDREDGLDGFVERVAGCMNMRNDAHAHAHATGNTFSPKSNTHPTVRPTDLMRYLCRLVTPPGGIVLDPFTGSGSTGKAAILEGFRFIGAEREAEYIAIARARIEAAMPADQLELQP